MGIRHLLPCISLHQLSCMRSTSVVHGQSSLSLSNSDPVTSTSASIFGCYNKAAVAWHQHQK